MERTKTDLCEVVALRKGDEDDEQMDEVEVEDEIEERDAAEDEEEAGYGVRRLVRGEWSGGGRLRRGVPWGRVICREVLQEARFRDGEDEEEAAEGEEAEVQRGRIFVDVQKGEEGEEMILLNGPGTRVAIAVDQAQKDEKTEGDQTGAEEDSFSFRGGWGSRSRSGGWGSPENCPGTRPMPEGWVEPEKS